MNILAHFISRGSFARSLLGRAPCPNRVLSALGILLVFVLPLRLFAGDPATRPWDDTPQAFLTNMTNDVVAAMTIDQVMGTINFDATSAKETASAKIIAAGIVAQSKLELAVRQRWGKDAEAAVAHASSDNVPSDAATAKMMVNGDHAAAIFQIDSLTPMLLVNVNGHWKIDMAGYEGMDPKFDRETQAGTALCGRLAQDLQNKDAYPDAGSFTKHVKEEMDKLGAN
jgi:hypothetical protein